MKIILWNTYNIYFLIYFWNTYIILCLLASLAFLSLSYLQIWNGMQTDMTRNLQTDWIIAHNSYYYWSSRSSQLGNCSTHNLQTQQLAGSQTRIWELCNFEMLSVKRDKKRKHKINFWLLTCFWDLVFSTPISVSLEVGNLEFN